MEENLDFSDLIEDMEDFDVVMIRSCCVISGGC